MVGVGGQGILLASEILAQAAMLCGYDVKTNEVHGMAQRGGSVMAQVRFGEEVFSPLVQEGKADALASLEAIEGLRAAHYLQPGALAVVNTQQIIPVTVSSGLGEYPADSAERCESVFPNLKMFNAVEIANNLGNDRVANIVIMGALSTGLELPVEKWQEAIRKSVKPKFVELNLEAFEKGRQAAK